MTTWNTDLGRIDVLVDIPDAEGMPVDFDALEPRSLRLHVNDTDVRVASLVDAFTRAVAGHRLSAHQARLGHQGQIASSAISPTIPNTSVSTTLRVFHAMSEAKIPAARRG